MTKRLHKIQLTTFAKIRIAGGIVLLGAAIIGVAYPLWWNHRSSTGAHKLLVQDNKVLSKSIKTQQSGGACTATPGPGVLQIPSLGLTAPVLQGLTNSVLNVSIGHDPATNWPGPKSAALFAAHDVSFFSHLGQLKAGDVITYTVPCATYTFTVSSAQVTSPGAGITVPGGGGLVLDTCWPPNALWFTPDRYVVSASYVSTGPQLASVTSQGSAKSLPSVNLEFQAPPEIPASELQLANNSQEMGQLHYSGTPSPVFEQSNAPLQVEAAALQGWFATLHTLESAQPTWWASFAKSIPYPEAYSGVALHSSSALQITEQVTGSTPTSVTLSGGENGHLFTIGEVIRHHTLAISSISIQ